ncbi:kelch-like protein 31 [Branchiostoma lanceolatum]|uniref:kelch-like protein 31 n=1 Tax=Branchiostoma lanceolatum TaxID=7740 RepID=UPI0034530001
MAPKKKRGANGKSSRPNSPRPLPNFEHHGKEISSGSHGDRVLQGLNRLRNDRLLCDVTVVCKGKTFDAHRAVLASCSDYFRSNFVGDANNKNGDVFELHGLSVQGVSTVINYAYTGKLHLTVGSVGSTIAAASYLQMPALVKQCCDFLMTDITVESCIDIANIASSYDLKSVKDFAEKYILENFVAFSDGEQFQRLSVDQLCGFLGNDDLLLHPELTVFQIALKWLNHDPNTRMQHVAKVMGHIRFPIIPAADLVQHVQTVPFMMRDPDCQAALVEAMNYHLLPHQQNVLQSRRTKLRSKSRVLVTVGGKPPQLDQPLTRRVNLLDTKTSTWQHLTDMVCKSGHQAAVVMDNFLYVVGGEDQYDASNQAKHSVNTAVRYDPRSNTWVQLAHMNERRTHFHVNAVSGRLLAVGGRNAGGTLSSVEMYDPAKNEWTYVSNLLYPRCCHAGAVHGGLLYIGGGYIGGTYSRSLICYRLSEDSWNDRTSMSQPRGWHNMVTVGEKIIAMGGSQLSGKGDRVDVMHVESYSPLNDQWTTLSPILSGVSTAGAAAVGNKVYVCGGWSESTRQYLKAAQCYDVSRDEWSWAPEMSGPLVAVSAIALTVPVDRVKTGGYQFGTESK